MIKKTLKWITPYGVVEARRRFLALSEPKANKAEFDPRDVFHNERTARIKAALECDSSQSGQQLDPFIYSNLINFLEARGIPRHHLLEGSIPEKSLKFLAETLIEQMPKNQPLMAVHIGNFVGVSLTFLTAILTGINSESRVIGVDPNLTHRGVADPQSHVAALLTACKLQRNVMLVAGYSSRKSISNDGVVFDGYDPVLQISSEFGCEDCIASLAELAPRQFDLVLMDGNHEAKYLQDELIMARRILRPGGLVVLDDVDIWWKELKAVFSRIGDLGFRAIGENGRIGIARLD
jgi:hypothetical protein